MTARHRVKKNKRTTKILVVPAVAALLVAGAVQPPMTHPAPTEVHQPHRAVSADAVALAALALFAVPGAGVNFPPGALAEQDGGIWQRIQDVTLLTDRTRYPGDVTAASLDSGASWLTELILARDPSTTVSGIDTGSFGGRVAAEALNRVAATGYDMSSVFAVFYGDSNTPGTGLFDRYRPTEPTFGSDIPGGAVPLPDGTYLRVNREYDPIAYFPRYLWNPVSWLQILAGFVFEHSRLGSFDFDDPENVTTIDGNVVTVRVNSPVMPILMPLKLIGVPTRIIQALQDVMQPMVESTGMYETGKVGLLPTPQKVVQYLTAIVKGFEKAGQRLAGTLPPDGPPNPPPTTDAPTTTSEIIDAMEARDKELNGTTASTARFSTARAVAPGGTAAVASAGPAPTTPVVASPAEGKTEEVSRPEVSGAPVQPKDNESVHDNAPTPSIPAPDEQPKTTSPEPGTDKADGSQTQHRPSLTARKPKRHAPKATTVSDPPPPNTSAPAAEAGKDGDGDAK